ncbi:dopamine beta-hydroxylase [Homalodisca vitripennis]|uniref:dopamine beta-hydroxylase n=1 Tax=Homalodisca vitripennis TaxID=197043 RepID=UPI001EEC04C2|nr:dopamine beta-hydroxylase [Homalodisca vitripennis]
MFIGTLLLCLLLSSGQSKTLPPGTFFLPLDARGAHTLYWRLDYDDRTVSMELHSQVPTGSWLALGFSDYGDIASADLCFFWTDWRGHTHLEDTWTTEDGKLYRDAQQDCHNWGWQREGDVIKLVFSKKFDTCDDYDYVIEEGTTHVVWATGPGPLFQLKRLDMTLTDHGFQRTQLLKNLASVVQMASDVWSLTVTEDNNQVPGGDTTYWCKVVRLDERLSRKHHIVKFEPVITQGNEPLVHHMELFHCEGPADKEFPLYRGPCDSEDRPEDIKVCKKVLAAWAMGATPFYFPQEAGLPVGGEGYNLYAMLEVHYNNPELREDWIDSSGLRVYVSPTLRQHDAGVIELGLEYIDKMAIPPGQPHFPLSGYCISECTGVSIPPEGITVFGSQLHTHLTGIRVMTRHIRDGRELPELNRDNHYSTHFQEIRLLKRAVKVLPGDALITTCLYNTTGRPNITLGGFAITDEMCVNYIYYYPKTSLEVCKSAISDQSLQTYFRQVHEWERQPTSPHMGISDNYRAIDWNPVRASVLHELYLQSPIYMQCNQSSGERFPGDWTSVPVTPVLYPLPPSPRICD